MTNNTIFAGTVEDDGDGYILTASSGGGSVRAKKEDVSLDQGLPFLRVGASVEFLKSPSVIIRMKNMQELDQSGAAVLRRDCRKWACIGFVQICCDDGRVEGGCIGVVGC